MSEMIQLTGLWLNQSKTTGEKYFSGNLGGAKVLIFKNKHKTEEKHPDYQLYIAPKQKPQEQSTQQQGQQGGPPDPAAREPGDGYPNRAGFNDDIPDSKIPF